MDIFCCKCPLAHESWKNDSSRVLQERAVEVGGKMATMESLAVYFILNEARDQLGFAPEEYGLSDDDAVTIARMFAKCALLLLQVVGINNLLHPWGLH